MLKNLTILAVFLSLTASAVLAVTGQTIQIQPVATMTWEQLEKLDQKISETAAVQERSIPYMPAPQPRELPAKTPIIPQNQHSLQSPRLTPAEPDATLGPALITSFAALGDDNTSIPPDTHGAAGPNHLMTMLNSRVRRQDLSGGTISTLTLTGFWASLGPFPAGGPFDPKIIYDPGSGRWMASCDAEAQSGNSSLLFAISSTSDPTGPWTFYRIDADPTNVNWADFDDIGVNNTWIAITNNMFTVAANAFSGAAMWVIDKSTALAGGPLTVTVFPAGFDLSGGVYGFALRPCLTFGPEPRLYLVDNSGWSSGGVFLIRISEITGTGPAPVWSATPGSPFPGTGLFSVANNFFYGQINAPQLGTGGLVRTNDPRMLNAIFRNGRIWCTQSAGLPIGGPPDRTAVFWYQLDPLAMPTPIVQSGFLDGGVGVHHFFPSITANSLDEALLGFSRSDASKFVEAVYTSRFASDPPGTMDPISVLKLGEDSYIKDFGTGSIRWGDYSAAVIDPRNDICMWTIQEYAATDVGPNPNDDRWGTWWGMVCSCLAQPGDVNGTPPISLPDAIQLVNYVFDTDRAATGCLGSDPGNCWSPNPLCRGEVNGTPPISLPDAIQLVNYIFDKDRPATACMGSDPGNCWTPVPTGVCCLPLP